MESSYPEKQKYCEQAYKQFSKIYVDLEKVLESEYNKEKWDKKRAELIGTVRNYKK